MKTKAFLIASVSLILAASWISSCQQDDSDLLSPKFMVSDVTGPTGSEITKGDVSGGLLLSRPPQDWTKEWWKFVMSFNCETNPLLTDSPIVPDFFQDGPVHFLFGGGPGSVVRDLRISQRKAILVPIINILNDFPCPDKIDMDIPAEKIEAYLKEGASAYIDRAENLAVTLDGKPLVISRYNRVPTDLFYFTGNKDLVKCFDPCVTGYAQAAVSDGYWVMMQGLPIGKHVIRVHAELTGYDLVYDATYNIVVF